MFRRRKNTRKGDQASSGIPPWMGEVARPVGMPAATPVTPLAKRRSTHLPSGLWFRSMVGHDHPGVAAIEYDLFGRLSLGEDDLRLARREKNVWGWVAECSGDVAGYVLWRLEGGGLRILRLAVAWRYQNRGIGTWIVQANALKRLNAARRPFCVAEVRESRVAAQQFFKAVGFRAVGMVRNRYSHRGDTGESSIVFEYVTPTVAKPEGYCSEFFILDGSETIDGMGGFRSCRRSP